MVFQKRARKCTECKFFINNQIIDVVHDYTYLGTRASSSGNFTVTLDHLKEKALHALFSLRRHTDFCKLKPSLACKIFDTMISPILTYNSEIWGVYTKPEFKAWDSSQIEKTHLQFCKCYLEVSNKTSNIACRAELGRFPLSIAISQRILNYILYLKNKNEDSLVKQSFLMSLGLHSAGKNSFHSNLMKMSEYFNLNNFNPDLLDAAKIKHFVSLMKQKYISYWQQAFQHSQKLEFYKIFKNEYAPSNYLELSTRTSERRALTKLLISNHKLMIELGRYNQISRDDRICPVCGSNQIEDEIHFLFYCSKYSIMRDNFPNKIQTLIPNVRHLPVNDLFIELMNSSIYFINIQLVKFISSCFDFRDELLSM